MRALTHTHTHTRTRDSQLNGALFFSVAMLGAVSMVLFYFFLLAGTVGGGGYLLYTAARNQALEAERRQRAYIRPHME